MELQSVFLKKLLVDLVQRKASSLHLSIGSSPMMRVYRNFVSLDEEGILKEEDINKIVSSFLTEEEQAELASKKELTMIKDFGENFRFRVSIFYQRGYLSLSFNYISETIRSLDTLNLPEIFKKNIHINTGLLIVAGPNDSGRTSTIASIIENINTKEKKYGMTIESNIERFFVNKKSIIDQRQLGVDVGSYVEGLKHCLEEDIDFVYVDDIRDNFADALPLILELASGNCLVMIEVNGQNSIRVLEKILNTKCQSLTKESIGFLLADVLLGIISQKLIPNQEGGLSLAAEVLISNLASRSMIREGKIYQLESVLQNSTEEGSISMTQSVRELLMSGKIDKKEVDDMDIEDE